MPTLNLALWMNGVPVTDDNYSSHFQLNTTWQYQLPPIVYNDYIKPMTLLAVMFTPCVAENDNWYVSPYVTLTWDNAIMGTTAVRFRVDEKKEPLPSGISVFHRELPVFENGQDPKPTPFTFALYVRAWA